MRRFDEVIIHGVLAIAAMVAVVILTLNGKLSGSTAVVVVVSAAGLSTASGAATIARTNGDRAIKAETKLEERESSGK